MSIAPISLLGGNSLLTGTLTPSKAVAAKTADFQTQLSTYQIKDQIELSKGAIALLDGVTPETAKK